jgi:hypothetical protein
MQSSGYKLSKEYLEKTYGVELEDMPTPAEPPIDTKNKKPSKKEDEKKKE